jgi:cytochrome b6-f complex iron-sulfur subunit
MKRKDFLHSLFAFIPLGIGFAGISFMGARFVSPRKTKKQYRKIYAMNLNDIAINESKPFYDLKGRELVLVRTGESTVKAISTTCTHLGCKVHWEADKNIFFCPCHNGVFNPDGVVLEGPPPRPLDTYRVDVEGKVVYLYSEIA